MSKPVVVIVGADKGGVGKSTTCRTLLDYYKCKNIVAKPFDTEPEPGVLKRFYPEAKIVDISHTDGQVSVFDHVLSTPVTVLDLKAGIMQQVLRDLGEIGFLEMAREGRVEIVVMHVLGNTVASFSEIKVAAAILTGAKHYLVKNRANDGAFFNWNADLNRQAMGVGEGVIEIPKLDQIVAEHLDASAKSISDFLVENQSQVLKGKLKSWRDKVFAQYDLIKQLTPVAP
jgi:hypothetical protein